LKWYVKVEDVRWARKSAADFTDRLHRLLLRRGEWKDRRKKKEQVIAKSVED